MIIRNSAACLYCGQEIESTYQHDFRVHKCAVHPMPERQWLGDILVDMPGKTTWLFAVDGGKAYIRRVGSGFKDTSIYTEGEDGTD